MAAAAGSAVPEVHLVWCCRSMAEMELVGEAIPSMLASAGNKKDSHFTMSLYCTSKVRKSKDPDRHEPRPHPYRIRNSALRTSQRFFDLMSSRGWAYARIDSLTPQPFEKPLPTWTPCLGFSLQNVNEMTGG